jgi:hypothetical protein
MADKWLKTDKPSEVLDCNATPYGYPSRGVALNGGVVEQSTGGVGWTVEQFPVEESESGLNLIVKVDDKKVPPGLVSKLSAAKPKVEEPKVKA